MPESRRAFPLWEQTKLKYVQDMWRAQELIVRYRDRQNPRDLRDLQSQLIKCWMNIRSYRDLLLKKDYNKEPILKLDTALQSMSMLSFAELISSWMFLSDAYKRLGIDDVGKQDDDEQDLTARMLEGYFDVD